MYTISNVYEVFETAITAALLDRHFDSLADAQEAVYAQIGDVEWFCATEEDSGKPYWYMQLTNPVVVVITMTW
jgi:hypothetical protein